MRTKIQIWNLTYSVTTQLWKSLKKFDTLSCQSLPQKPPQISEHPIWACPGRSLPIWACPESHRCPTATCQAQWYINLSEEFPKLLFLMPGCVLASYQPHWCWRGWERRGKWAEHWCSSPCLSAQGPWCPWDSWQLTHFSAPSRTSRAAACTLYAFVPSPPLLHMEWGSQFRWSTKN